MRTTPVIAGLALLLLSGSGAQATSIKGGDHQRMASGLVDAVVVPVYRAHAESMRTLAESSRAPAP